MVVGMRAIDTPHVRTTLVKTAATIESGKKMARDVRDWMERNEDAFWAILGYVKDMQRKGVTGRVRDRVAVYCITNAIEVDDDPYKFANAKFAGIARYMALIDPTLVNDPLRFNDSVIDCYGLLPVSYLPELEVS